MIAAFDKYVTAAIAGDDRIGDKSRTAHYADDAERAADRDLVSRVRREPIRSAGVEMPKPSLTTHSIALRTRLLMEGRYVSTCARSIVRCNADHYALAILPIAGPVQPLPAGVLTLKNRTLSPLVERLLEIARLVAKCFAAHASSTDLQ